MSRELFPAYVQRFVLDLKKKLTCSLFAFIKSQCNPVYRSKRVFDCRHLLRATNRIRIWLFGNNANLSRNRNLKHLYIISTVVADERYQLYRDFFTTSTADGKPKNRLLEYLYAMREVGLGALESGNRDPFSVLAQ